MNTRNMPGGQRFRNTITPAFMVWLLLLVTACTGTGGISNLPDVVAIENSAASRTPSSPKATLALAVEATLPVTPDTSIPPTELDIEILRNSIYRGILDEGVRLTGGAFEGEPIMTGGASRPVVTLLPEPIAFGDLNGDGQTDAAVLLVSDSGGSGSFVYLAAVESRDGVADNVATLFLGDRVQVKSLEVDGGRLVATLLSHAPDDPACCPSLEQTLNLKLSGDQFTDAGE